MCTGMYTQLQKLYAKKHHVEIDPDNKETQKLFEEKVQLLKTTSDPIKRLQIEHEFQEKATEASK